MVRRAEDEESSRIRDIMKRISVLLKMAEIKRNEVIHEIRIIDEFLRNGGTNTVDAFGEDEEQGKI